MTATKARDVTPSWLLLQGFTHVCNVGLEAVFQKELPTVQMPVVVTLMLIRGACLSWPPNAVKDHATQQDISLFLMALSDNGSDPQPVTAESLQSLGAVYEGQQWCFGKAPRILQVRLNQKHLGGENSWWLTTSESVVGDRVPQAMAPRNVYEAKLLLDRLGISY